MQWILLILLKTRRNSEHFIHTKQEKEIDVIKMLFCIDLFIVRRWYP